MEALMLTIPLSLLLSLLFIGIFIWSALSGQMEEMESQKNIIFHQNEGDEPQS